MGRRQVLQNDSTGNRVIRVPQVLDKAGVGRTKLYEMIEQGEFPRPFRLGLRAIGWLERDVERWIQLRVKAGRRERKEQVGNEAREES
jgi:prophage regulatory protein